MNQDFFKILKTRRCVRKFKTDPIADSILQKVLAGALLAPSAGNVQPWKFYVIRKLETKALLALAAFGQQFLAQAPVVVVVTAEPEISAAKYGTRGKELYSVQDTAAAVENILLGATAQGLASCWVGAFDEEATRQTLGLAPSQRPMAIIPLGYSAETPQPRQLKPTAEVIVFVD